MAKKVIAQSYEEFAEAKKAELIAKYEEKGKELSERSLNFRAARAYLRDFAKGEGNLDSVPEISEALRVLFYREPKQRSGGSTGGLKAKIRKAIRELLENQGTVTEQEVFMTSMNAGAAWGRAEMRDFIKRSIRDGEPEDRIWVKLETSADEPMGSYVVVGSGAEAPTGWEGYVPVNEEVDL